MQSCLVRYFVSQTRVPFTRINSITGLKGQFYSRHGLAYANQLGKIRELKIIWCQTNRNLHSLAFECILSSSTYFLYINLYTLHIHPTDLKCSNSNGKKIIFCVLGVPSILS